jgi:sulfite reductase (NADPH) hemoprotein beta-component
VIERIVDTYLALRASAAEEFIDTVRRVGLDPFRPALQPRELEREAA